MIESDEPPIKRVLDCKCHNELCKAMGEDDCEFVDVGFVQGLFSQLVDLWPSKISKRSPANSKQPKHSCVTETA